MALFAFFVFLPWAPPLGESLPLDSRCVPVAALAEFLLVALAWLDGDPPSAFLTVEETRLCTRAAPSLVKSSSPRVTELSDESTNHDWLVSLDWLPTAEVELTRKHRTVPEAPHTDDSIARDCWPELGVFLTAAAKAWLCLSTQGLTASASVGGFFTLMTEVLALPAAFPLSTRRPWTLEAPGSSGHLTSAAAMAGVFVTEPDASDDDAEHPTIVRQVRPAMTD
ncbi:hypothetical protein HMPREF0043_01384 [Actinobaculum sp. oral taxon 183 str. F0552]|nr:hypothetical protein HMPREF0043_01384 [Actinobaculum sp. oral taxon 183 str. F0552]